MFDTLGDGIPEQISWTAAKSDDSWLALDRNGNGLIDNGRELFGSSTPQPYLLKGDSKNGFRALAVFDTTPYGGNGDGRIDRDDTVFYLLKLGRTAITMAFPKRRNSRTCPVQLSA